MIHLVEKFKIPTLLGLGVILIGIVAGLLVVLKDQNFLLRAQADVTPQDVTFTNNTDSKVSVSWKTANPTFSFITFGQNNPSEQTSLDDRDQGSPQSHIIHYVTLTNLLPNTEYQLKIVTGRKTSEVFKFKTASPKSFQNNFGPVIGSVVEGDKPLIEGLVYLAISGATIQSSLIKSLGSFLIPLPQIRQNDLSNIFPVSEDTVAKLTIIGKSGQATALFRLKKEGVTLPVLKLGQNLDLTIQESPQPIPTVQELNRFDLNEDGLINANDHSIVLLNFGKNPREKKTDFNSDGVVDQKDLEQIATKINKSFTP